MGFGRAAVYGVLDAAPFAVGLGLALLSVGEMFAPGELLAITVLLSLGLGLLLAMISASRYVADGSRFWLVWNFADLFI